jgi:hypothetical protein
LDLDFFSQAVIRLLRINVAKCGIMARKTFQLSLQKILRIRWKQAPISLCGPLEIAKILSLFFFRVAKGADFGDEKRADKTALKLRANVARNRKQKACQVGEERFFKVLLAPHLGRSRVSPLPVTATQNNPKIQT